MAGSAAGMFLLAVLVGIAGAQTTEKPCGDFPWNTAEVTVDCDYGYSRTWTWPDVTYVRGRCRVSCLDAELLVGPSGDQSGYGPDYYCSVNNASWTGTEPVCIGGFDNSSVTESEANRVRLVGGEFYGCVELYDDVTQQWGPVVGINFDGYGSRIYESRMAWADLVCRDVGFTGGLATWAFPSGRSYIYSISNHFYPSYSRPSDTGPNFFLNTSSPVSAGGVQHLSDTVGRVVRGDCTATERSWDCEEYLMCLACQRERQTCAESCDLHASCSPSAGRCVCEPGWVGDGVHCQDYDECSDPEKTDCSPHAACLNTDGSFSCSCIMGYQDKSPDVASRPGRVCEPEGVSDSWVPAAAGAAATAAVFIIAIATVMCLRRAKRKSGLKDVEGPNNLVFTDTSGKPAETVNSASCRN